MAQIIPQKEFTPGSWMLHGGFPVEALPFIEREITANPKAGGLWNNFGMCHKFMGHYDIAIESFKKCVELEPWVVRARHNLGMAYEETGRFDEALREYAYVCSWEPDENTVYALASCLMREKRFDRALEYWERARLGKLSAVVYPNIRMWRGESLAGKNIIVTREGGFGDIIWLLRYLKPLKELGAHVTFHVHKPIVELLRGHPFTDAVQAHDAKVDDQVFDYQIPLWSLPWELRKLGLAEVPMNRGAYLEVRETLLGHVGTRVGLAPYTGEALSVHRKMRAIQPELVDLFRSVPVDWTWLNTEPAPEWCSAAISPTSSWSDTAAVIAHLDAVVAVDSSVMHLAAAMGKRVYALIPLGSDWKFFNDQHSTDWYPTMRLVRNTDPVSFRPAVERAIEILQEELCEEKMSMLSTS